MPELIDRTKAAVDKIRRVIMMTGRERGVVVNPRPQGSLAKRPG